MGTSATGTLAYGYDLGGYSASWALHEAGENGELVLRWYDWMKTDFASAARHVLLASVGFTEADEDSDGYHERRKAAKARLGVKIRLSYYDDCGSFQLVTKVIRAYDGGPQVIDMVDIAEAPHVHGWDSKLDAALATLGLTPTQERPAWLLGATLG